jgi:hypothetical protein
MRSLNRLWLRSLMVRMGTDAGLGRGTPRRKALRVGRPEQFESRLLLSINPVIVEESESNNDSATANALGVTVDNAVLAVGTLPAGDRDFFSFTAPAGAKVWAYIDTGAARNVTGSSADSFLSLFTTDGVTLIESDDDDGSSNGGDDTQESGTGSVIAGRTLTAAGTYFLEVRPFSGTAVVNPYKLFVSITTTAPAPEGAGGNNTAAVAVPIGGATPVRSAQISPANDIDFYSFTAVAGDQVFIAVDGDPERDNTLTNVSVSLIGQNGTSAINTTATDSGTGAEGTNFRLVTGGTYFVRIQGVDNTITGTYHLLVQVGQAARYTPEVGGDNNSSATAQPLNASSPIIAVGNLPVGDRDFYSFTAPANSRVWAFAETGGIRNVTGSSRDITLALFTTDGVTQITFADDGAGGSGDDNVGETAASAGIAGRKLAAAGTYFFRVEDFGNNDVIDPYRLFVYVTADTGLSETEGNNTAAVANAIGGAAGNLKEANISAGDVDFYSIVLRAGDILWAGLNGDPEQDSSNTDVNFGLIAPDATSALVSNINNSGTFEMGSYRAIVSGTYFIRVAQQGASTGTYQLMAQVISASNTAPTLNTAGSPYAILGVGARQSTEMRQGTLISDILARGAGGNPISDPDAAAKTGIAIIFYDGAFGGFEYTLVTSNPAESDWTDVLATGVITNDLALLLPPTARLRFKTTLIPHHDTAPIFLPIGSKLDAGLLFRAWDQTTGVAGGRVSTAVNGGSTAFSSAIESAAVYFEARLYRHFNRNASLNVYTLEAEFNALAGGSAFEDRSTAAFTGFTVLLSAVPEVGTVPLYRMYYGVQFNSNGTEVDMGYRYLTSNLGEATFLEGLGPPDKRAARSGTYFRELGVSAGTAILGHIFTTSQPGTQQLVQIYRTDIVQKPTRPPGTVEGSTPTSFTPQENGDHVYTTNTAFETTRPGTWRVESSRGFARPLSANPPPATAAALASTASSTSDRAAESPSTVVRQAVLAPSFTASVVLGTPSLPLNSFDLVAGLVASPTVLFVGSSSETSGAYPSENAVADQLQPQFVPGNDMDDDTDNLFLDLDLLMPELLGV